MKCISGTLQELFMSYLPLDLGIIRQDNSRHFACPKSSFHRRKCITPSGETARLPGETTPIGKSS
jgi:hypothetical protein